MPARIWHDAARRLLIASVEGSLQTETVRSTIAAVTAIYQRTEPVLNLTILRRDLQLRAADRSLAGKLFAEQNALAARAMIASAVIAESPLQRGVLTAVNWINPAPHPQRVFGELEPALEYLNSFAAAKGIPPLAAAEIDLRLTSRRPTHSFD